MVNDDIKVTTEYSEYYDKKDIAVIIRDSTFDSELGCSLLDEEIRMDCEGCGLKFICEGIEKVAKAYVEENTKVVSNFNVD